MSDNIQYTTPEAPRRSNAVLGFVLVLLLAGIGAALYFGTRPKPTVAVQRDIDGQVVTLGTITAPATAQGAIYAPFQGPVQKVDHNLGSYVTRGEPVVELSQPDADTALQQAKENLKLAETAYANAKKQYDEPVRAAKNNLSAAQAATSQTSQTTTTDNPTGNSSAVTVTRASTQTTGPDVNDLRAALADAIANRDSALVTYQQQLNSAREAYQEAKAGKTQTIAKAPINGTITELNAQPGQTVGADARVPIARVVDLSAIQVTTALDQISAPTVKKDMPVKLTFKELPGKEFEGKVTSVSPKIVQNKDGSKSTTYYAVIDFKNTKGQVWPNMTPTIQIATGSAKQATVVPIETIQQDSTGRSLVKVERANKWIDVPVETGLTDGKFVQVKSGIQPNEVIGIPSNLKLPAAK